MNCPAQNNGKCHEDPCTCALHEEADFRMNEAIAKGDPQQLLRAKIAYLEKENYTLVAAADEWEHGLRYLLKQINSTWEEMKAFCNSPEADEYGLGPMDFIAHKIEQARKDAARYQWLRSRNNNSNRYPHITQYPYCAEIDDEMVLQVFDLDGYHPDRLDAAIDTAIEKEKAAK